MTRRNCLKLVAIAFSLAPIAPARAGAAQQQVDELCDERGACLVSEDGARLTCG